MNYYLIPTLEFGPKVIARLVQLLPAACLDEAAQPDRFTPRQVMAHLADWEPVLRQRIRTALTHPGTTIQPWDESRMAVDHEYDRTDPQEQAELLIRERRVTAELLRSLSSADWSRHVVHPERGRQSVEDMANSLLGHDLYHIEQLSGSLPPASR